MRDQGVFKDFIPEGSGDESAFGKGGFRDFVPEPEPKSQVVEEETEVVVDKKKKK